MSIGSLISEQGKLATMFRLAIREHKQAMIAIPEKDARERVDQWLKAGVITSHCYNGGNILSPKYDGRMYKGIPTLNLKWANEQSAIHALFLNLARIAIVTGNEDTTDIARYVSLSDQIGKLRAELRSEDMKKRIKEVNERPDTEVSLWVKQKTAEGVFTLEKLHQSGTKGRNYRRAARKMAEVALASANIKQQFPDARCETCENLSKSSYLSSTGYYCASGSDWQWTQPVHLHEFCHKYRHNTTNGSNNND